MIVIEPLQLNLKFKTFYFKIRNESTLYGALERTDALVAYAHNYNLEYIYSCVQRIQYTGIQGYTSYSLQNSRIHSVNSLN